MQILCNVPYDIQPSDWFKYVIFRPLCNRPNKPVYDVTFAPRFCVVSRWLPANKSVVFDYLSDPGLRRIPCYTLLHRTEVLSLSIELYLKSNQSNFISRSIRLAQLFRTNSGIDLIVKIHKERFPNYHCLCGHSMSSHLMG